MTSIITGIQTWKDTLLASPRRIQELTISAASIGKIALVASAAIRLHALTMIALSKGLSALLIYNTVFTGIIFYDTFCVLDNLAQNRWKCNLVHSIDRYIEINKNTLLLQHCFTLIKNLRE